MEIDTSKIFKITQKSGRFSLTFRIVNDSIPNRNTTQNLVIDVFSENNFYAYITEYDLNEEQKMSYLNGELQELTGFNSVFTLRPDLNISGNLKTNELCTDIKYIPGSNCTCGANCKPGDKTCACYGDPDGPKEPVLLIKLVPCDPAGGNPGTNPSNPNTNPWSGNIGGGDATSVIPGNSNDDPPGENAEPVDFFLDGVETTPNLKYNQLQVFLNTTDLNNEWNNLNLTQKNAIKTFFDINGFNTDTSKLVEEYLEITNTITSARFKRYKELNNIIKNDAWALIEDCAQQNGMDTQDYLNLYNLELPQACQTRLDNLGNEYKHQPLDEGDATLANLDYYGVEITNIPDFNGDNQPDTQSEIIQAFKENFTDLASGEKSDFQFSCNIPNNTSNEGDIGWDFVPFTEPYDNNLFLSNNPLSAILMIQAAADIPGVILEDFTVDDGAIIVSDYTSNDWTISTIQTPYTGSQPFSGNRQWGLFINQNGNIEFFTKAVDVAKFSDLAKKLGNPECNQNTYYDIAEATWLNLQNELINWVYNHGDQANISDTKAARVDKDKIIDLLCSPSTITIADLDCN